VPVAEQPENLRRDLPAWSSGLFPFFQYAATSVKVSLVSRAAAALARGANSVASPRSPSSSASTSGSICRYRRVFDRLPRPSSSPYSLGWKKRRASSSRRRVVVPNSCPLRRADPLALSAGRRATGPRLGNRLPLLLLPERLARPRHRTQLAHPSAQLPRSAVAQDGIRG
jgi:hypothetical protein